VVLEPVRVWRASDYSIALRAQRLSFLALTERVVEHDDVGPRHFALPVAHFRHETVSDVALLLVLNAIADFVAFLRHLPCDIADQPCNRNETKLALVTVHWARSGKAGLCMRLFGLASSVEILLLKKSAEERRRFI